MSAHRRRALAACALLLGACAAPGVDPRGASGPEAANATPAPVRAAPPPRSLGELAWLSGTWRQQGDPCVQETWSEPADDMLVGSGLVSDMRSGRALFFEHLRIELADGVLCYVALPRGRGETRFTATEVRHGRLRFENPAHDDPKVIEYLLDGPNVLITRVEGARVAEARLERLVR